MKDNIASIANHQSDTAEVPTVSVIIVSYQVRDLLRDCLRSVRDRADDLLAEVWVVDNASDDDSAGMVASEFPWVKLIRNTRNRGFAGAANQALAKATGKYILLLNPDTLITDTTIPILTAFLDRHAGAGVAGPLIRQPDGRLQRPVWPFPTLLSTIGSTLFSIRLGSRIDSGTQPPLARRKWSEPHPGDWISGACMLVRRSAFEDVGPLDERFFMYMEDVDWCKRFWQAGWSVWFVPDAQVVHLGGQSATEFNVAKGTNLWFLQTAPNHYIYFRKHDGPAAAWLVKAAHLLAGLGGFIKWNLTARRSTDPSSRQRAQLYREKLVRVWNM